MMEINSAQRNSRPSFGRLECLYHTKDTRLVDKISPWIGHLSEKSDFRFREMLIRERGNFKFMLMDKAAPKRDIYFFKHKNGNVLSVNFNTKDTETGSFFTLQTKDGNFRTIMDPSDKDSLGKIYEMLLITYKRIVNKSKGKFTPKIDKSGYADLRWQTPPHIKLSPVTVIKRFDSPELNKIATSTDKNMPAKEASHIFRLVSENIDNFKYREKTKEGFVFKSEIGDELILPKSGSSMTLKNNDEEYRITKDDFYNIPDGKPFYFWKKRFFDWMELLKFKIMDSNSNLN